MILDGYRILREVHASKRTQVYIAEDTITGKQVVIKTPSINFDDDPEYIDRFLREEWVGRRINSPHVMKVIDPKRQRHFLYYVTEYIEGQTLRQWMIDIPRPSLTLVRTLTAQISTGLRAFHRLEMIHQDLKPENIMIDTNGTAKIIDFGSTRIAGIQELSTPLEQPRLLGTLDYAAPEYFLDHSGSNRSDIYSLGAIVYEMLTGKLPYNGALSSQNIKRARYHPARQHNDEVLTWIDRTLEKAVHLRPEQRYALLSEFNYDLGHPNKSFMNKKTTPLMQRNPLAFWKGLAAMLVIINLILIYILSSP
jgi:serine/threonine protein kinase